MHRVGRGPLGIVVRARSVPFDPQVRALFWALSTMSSLGYGDGPSAQTNLEYLWAITCQVRVRVRVKVRVRVRVRVRDRTSRDYVIFGGYSEISLRNAN